MNLNDNKKFWKKIKLFFSDKGVASSNIVALGDIITDNQKLTYLFNTYLENITDTLQLKKLPLKISISLWNYFFLWESWQSISKIKESNVIPKQFCFKQVSSTEMRNIIKTLSRKKYAIRSCIPVCIMIDG